MRPFALRSLARSPATRVCSLSTSPRSAWSHSIETASSKLLRSLADEGVAILSSTGEGTGFLGADRVLALDKGKLDGDLTPDLAPVTDLNRHRQARG